MRSEMRRDLSETGLRLAAQVALYVSTCDRDRHVPPSEGDVGRNKEPSPLARIEVPLERGRTRRLVARRTSRPDEASEFDAAALLEGIPESGRFRVALYLLEACRTAFRLENDATYAANMRLLISELFASRKPLVPCATLGERLVLLTTKIPTDLGPASRAISIGPSAVRRIPFAPSTEECDEASAEANAYVMAPASLAEPDSTIILVGESGLAVRQVARRRPLSTIFQYLGRNRVDRRAEARFILEWLSARHAGEFISAKLAHEIGALAAERSASRAAPRTGALDIRVCAATPSGVFFGGRLADRHDMVRALEIQGPGFETRVGSDELFRLSRSSDGNIDFLAFAATADRSPRPGQFVVTPCFASGAKGTPAPAIAATTGRTAREQILHALPSQSPAALIERIAAPALIDLARNPPAPLSESRDIAVIGTRPADISASLVVPFGRERDVLVALAGALSVDTALRRCELVFVLDRVGARREAELALSFLWAAYGLASRLIVLPDAVGRLDFLAAGISAAATDSILVLGDGMVPDRIGWSEALLDGLHADDRIAVCGGRILNPDGSMWSAGLSLADRPDASLCVTSDGAGLPAADVPFAQPSLGVSLRFCALRRAAWSAAADERRSYLTEAWTDLDFCARLRRAGWAIGHAPLATALRVDRTRRPTGLGSENESRIDGYCFARWMTHETPLRNFVEATEAPSSLSAAA
jgi:hypothetical protein